MQIARKIPSIRPSNAAPSIHIATRVQSPLAPPAAASSRCASPLRWRATQMTRRAWRHHPLSAGALASSSRTSVDRSSACGLPTSHHGCRAAVVNHGFACAGPEQDLHDLDHPCCPSRGCLSCSCLVLPQSVAGSTAVLVLCVDIFALVHERAHNSDSARIHDWGSPTPVPPSIDVCTGRDE